MGQEVSAVVKSTTLNPEYWTARFEFWTPEGAALTFKNRFSKDIQVFHGGFIRIDYYHPKKVKAIDSVVAQAPVTSKFQNVMKANIYEFEGGRSFIKAHHFNLGYLPKQLRVKNKRSFPIEDKKKKRVS